MSYVPSCGDAVIAQNATLFGLLFGALSVVTKHGRLYRFRNSPSCSLVASAVWNTVCPACLCARAGLFGETDPLGMRVTFGESFARALLCLTMDRRCEVAMAVFEVFARYYSQVTLRSFDALYLI